MKVTKYLHSCLLIEEQDKKILIDPGIFTYEQKVLDLASLEKLDYVLVTHEHYDHMHTPFIQDIVKRFPEVKIFGNNSVQAILEKEGVTVSLPDIDVIQHKNVPHEKLFSGVAPENTLFTIFHKLTHPGDSLTFDQTAEVLALPIQAPWGSTTWAVETALKLKPKIIIPIHDYHWRDEIRVGMYDYIGGFLAEHGIQFMKMETGNTIEV